MELGDETTAVETRAEDVIMDLRIEQLERFLDDARAACAEDVQEIAGEIHEDYDEAPLFVLLYRDHDLQRFGRNLAGAIQAHFPDRMPPFTVSAITRDDRTERHLVFVEGANLLEQLERLRAFDADTTFPRREESVFRSGSSREMRRLAPGPARR